MQRLLFIVQPGPDWHIHYHFGCHLFVGIYALLVSLVIVPLHPFTPMSWLFTAAARWMVLVLSSECLILSDANALAHA